MPPEMRGYDPSLENPIVAPNTDFSAAGRKRERVAAEKAVNEIELFQKVLGFFGTIEAREKFIRLCEQYVEIYHLSSSSGSEKPKIQNIKREQVGRSHYHNQIMEILGKLITHEKTGSPTWKLLEHFQDRSVVERVLLQGGWKE